VAPGPSRSRARRGGASGAGRRSADSIPTLVFAGRKDDTVPLAAVERFAALRPARELVVLDAGHEMTEVLEPMWERVLPFLRRLGAL